MELRRLTAEDPLHGKMVEEVVMAAPAYSLLIADRLPNAQDARETLTLCPPGIGADDKFVLAVNLRSPEGEELLGCVDLVRGYPGAETAFLGLLLLKERWQGRGIGSRVLTEVMALAAGWGCSRLRLGVIESNRPALSFWRRHGFEPVARKQIAGFTGDTLVMERAVCHPYDPAPAKSTPLR